MPKRFRSDVMESVHDAAADLYAVSGMDRKTMRKFDVLCLTPIQKMTPKKFELSGRAKRQVKRSLRPTSM
jgi:putative transcriptional regulator